MISTLRATILLLIILLGLPCVAHAERKLINYSASSGQPSWKLENYMGNSVVIWNAGSSCEGGSLTMPEGATAGDKNRLYATLTAAKASGVTMFIYYETSDCKIISFGLLWWRLSRSEELGFGAPRISLCGVNWRNIAKAEKISKWTAALSNPSKLLLGLSEGALP